MMKLGDFLVIDSMSEYDQFVDNLLVKITICNCLLDISIIWRAAH